MHFQSLGTRKSGLLQEGQWSSCVFLIRCKCIALLQVLSNSEASWLGFENLDGARDYDFLFALARQIGTYPARGKRFWWGV